MINSDRRAFPRESQTQGEPGLTKLEYFSGLAMQGFLMGFYSNIENNSQVAA